MIATSRSHRPARSRLLAVASGAAALALVAGGCGESGDAEQVAGDATSAVGSVAAEATSAVGDATGDGGDGQSATTAEGPGPEDSGDGGSGDDGEGGSGDSGNPDEEFLTDIRRVGVDAEQEQDYLTRGREACASLDGGTGYVDVITQYNDAHPDAPVTEAPVVVTAAVKAFCSQHLPQVGQGGGDGEG